MALSTGDSLTGYPSCGLLGDVASPSVDATNNRIVVGSKGGSLFSFSGGSKSKAPTPIVTEKSIAVPQSPWLHASTTPLYGVPLDPFTGWKPVPPATSVVHNLSGESKGEKSKGQDWPMFRKCPKHTGYTSELVEPPLYLQWQYETDGPIISSPAIVGSTVYIGSMDSCFYAINTETHTLKWRYKTERRIMSSPAVVGETVYFGSTDGCVYTINIETGQPIWNSDLGGTNLSSPTVIDNLVYVGSGYPNTCIYALSVYDGKPIHQYETNQMVYSSPAVDEGVVYVGSDDSRFYAFDGAGGSPIWSFPTDGGIFFSSPVVAESLVYCIPGDYDKNIYAIDKETGDLEWSYNIDGSKKGKSFSLESRPYLHPLITALEWVKASP